MFKKFNTPIKFTAILSLIFILVFSHLWADNDDNDDNDDWYGNWSENTSDYYASEIIEFGNGTTIDVVNKGNKIIKIWVDSQALDDYMIEQDIKEVNLTVEVIETYVKPKKG